MAIKPLKPSKQKRKDSKQAKWLVPHKAVSQPLTQPSQPDRKSNCLILNVPD